MRVTSTVHIFVYQLIGIRKKMKIQGKWFYFGLRSTFNRIHRWCLRGNELVTIVYND